MHKSLKINYASQSGKWAKYEETGKVIPPRPWRASTNAQGPSSLELGHLGLLLLLLHVHCSVGLDESEIVEQ
jgi:hypothetical protein